MTDNSKLLDPINDAIMGNDRFIEHKAADAVKSAERLVEMIKGILEDAGRVDPETITRSLSEVVRGYAGQLETCHEHVIAARMENSGLRWARGIIENGGEF